MSRILTTHVGSLPRSQDVVDFIFARENNKKYDKNEFDLCMKRNVLETAEKQRKAGIDILMDADIRINYAGNGNIRKGNYKRAYTYFNIIRKHSPENIFTRICALLCTDKLKIGRASCRERV